LNNALRKIICVVHKRYVRQPKKVTKFFYEEQKKGKALQNRFVKLKVKSSKLRDIQQDETFASNYDKHIEDAYLIAYNKRKRELDKYSSDWEPVQEEIDNAS
jgi:ATP-binding cassette subfamily F protein 3